MKCYTCGKEIDEQNSINGVCKECHKEVLRRIDKKNEENSIIKELEKNRRIEELAQLEINDIKKSVQNINYKTTKKKPTNWIQAFGGAFLIVISINLFFRGLSNTLTSDENDTYKGSIYTSDGKRDIYSTDFTLLENETTGSNEDGIYTITGKIKQNIEGNYNTLMISFTLYDKNHNKVRKTSGFTFSNYEGNGIWSFTVSGNDADNIVTSYELDYCYGT